MFHIDDLFLLYLGESRCNEVGDEVAVRFPNKFLWEGEFRLFGVIHPLSVLIISSSL